MPQDALEESLSRPFGVAPRGGLPRRLIVAFVSNAITTAQNLAAPIAGNYRLVLVGPGASGACNASGSTYGLNGGGSGGVVVSKIFALGAKQTQAVVLGSPGAPVAQSAGAGLANGNSGSSATTATLPDGTVLIAGPGSGGSFGTSAPSVGGQGGSASGGEFNFPGGNGGIGNRPTLTANGGPREILIANGTSFTSNIGSQGSVGAGSACGGGGNTPSAGGIIPAARGSDGVSASADANVVDPPANSPALAGRGGGAANSANSGATSGGGGLGGAYLVLESLS